MFLDAESHHNTDDNASSVPSVTLSASQTQITPAQTVTNITKDQIDSLMAIESLIAETVAQEKASQQPGVNRESPEAQVQTVQILTVKQEVESGQDHNTENNSTDSSEVGLLQ